ncbi:hypothetical protein [Cognaticolwellia mytili]|uniref:hypothetical protein n=1 Tax=Cognaticolwellia mytili TaxID=1888913 RepID=UPI000A171431|nr:hypothetical protein [Cognaticolwellia mytili]
MSARKYLLITMLMLNGMLSTLVSAEEHQHHAMNKQTLQLDHGKKWSIDESLHKGMSNIRQMLMLNLDDIHYDKFSKQQFLMLANKVDQQLSYLFEHCKLPAQADAQLHLLLAKIMKGSGLMKGSENPKYGAILLIQALQDYPVYFDDINWQKITH